MSKNYVEGFDDRLRKSIRDRKMSYNQVSILTHISWNSMNGYLNGKQMPCCSHLVRLSKLLKVSTDYLLGLKGE